MGIIISKRHQNTRENPNTSVITKTQRKEDETLSNPVQNIRELLIQHLNLHGPLYGVNPTKDSVISCLNGVIASPFGRRPRTETNVAGHKSTKG
jgi:hypothetical protein